MKRALGVALVFAAGAVACSSSSSSSDGTGGGSIAGGNGGSSGVEQTCVDTINNYRKTMGLPAYARWNDEETCADGQAASDSTTMKAHGSFGTCMELAQNECPGWPGPASNMITQCLAQMWNEGPGGGHYEAMRNKNYTKVSCGFHTATDGTVWAVQNFR